MIASDAALLDVLAACLGAGVPLPDSLSRIEAAGFEAARWVQQVRPFARPESSVEDALLAARAIDAAEHAMLHAAVTPDSVARVLRALAARRRRRDSLRRTLLRALVGPFSIAALSVVLDPLPNLIGSGSYAWPVFRGMVVLALVAAFTVFGIPALLRSPTLGPPLVALGRKLPGLAWLAGRHAEGELVTLSAPFVGGTVAGRDGLMATAGLLSWSPLGEKVRVAAEASTETPAWALVRLAPSLSVATNLEIVSGTATGELPSRLSARGDQIAAELTSHARFAIRVGAYALVVVLTVESLVNLLGRAMPGGGLLPGATPSAEQKELDEVMKELTK